ncbi:xylulokinase [uncultured Jatrophihabitans sp.]|uniref:xylulokinase n=1 Tax=uncultured Jatrophihabitans sp. TaxID=1610747 RepID=UPI0035C957DB
MTLVAGVDSSTQSCKVVVHDADSGAVVRAGTAAHPDGTEIDPEAWWQALNSAARAAGGLADVAAVSVAAQQHGMICLDESGEVVRPALLWNDVRSAAASVELTNELTGGRQGWADAVGSALVPSYTVTKLRWLAEHEPDHLARTAAVCLPHDWLTWRLGGREQLTTDRSDASGTGYWSPAAGAYRDDLLVLACGERPALPRVLGPVDTAGPLSDVELGSVTAAGRRNPDVVLGAGAGDNAAAALGVGLRAGDVLVSLGTSGVTSSVRDEPSADQSGAVAGFADATGRFLPLVCTLNASRVFDATARMLGVGLDAFTDLALAAPSGAEGVVVVPYWEGERTPDKPDSTGAIHGLQLASATPANIARAAVEGVLCGVAAGLDALRAQGVDVARVLLVGGGARSEAVRRISPAVLGVSVTVPREAELTARGAARQAAWALSQAKAPPPWPAVPARQYDADPAVEVRTRFAEARDLTIDRLSQRALSAGSGVRARPWGQARTRIWPVPGATSTATGSGPSGSPSA